MNNKQTDNLLEVNNIEVVYNDIIQVLRGVSLNVKEGSIVALLGTNGAGKTTTLRAISGLLKPENGFIRDGFIKFAGTDVTNVLGTNVVKLGAVMVPEGRRVFKHLTVDENIFGLLFNTNFIAPEAYTFLPLFSAVAQGASGKSIKQQVRANYQKYHQDTRIPSRFFVNSSSGLAKYLLPFEGDQDQDQLPNRIDPEPRVKNQHEKGKNSIIIHMSNGQRLEISHP